MTDEQSPSLYETVVSYIPGFGGSNVHDEHHKAESGPVSEDTGNQGSGQGTINTSAENAGGKSGSGDAAAKGSSGYGSAATGNTSNQGASGLSSDRTGAGNTGGNTGGVGQHSTRQGANYNPSDRGQYTDSGSEKAKKPDVFYEDSTEHRATQGHRPGSADSSGKASSGAGSGSTYFEEPKNTGGQQTGGGNTGQANDGVRGAPIEGENLKGYAIGAPVGSGDTEKPSKPGDPSGQVSGSHLEYGPEQTDNRDQTGRGTQGTTKGESDSSFANVKRDDGRGNSEHVVTRSSASHMSSTTTTQL